MNIFALPWTRYTTQTHYANVSLPFLHKIHSHVNLELAPEHKSKVIQNHERQKSTCIAIFEEKPITKPQECLLSWRDVTTVSNESTRLWRRLDFCCEPFLHTAQLVTCIGQFTLDASWTVTCVVYEWSFWIMDTLVLVSWIALQVGYHHSPPSHVRGVVIWVPFVSSYTGIYK